MSVRAERRPLRVRGAALTSGLTSVLLLAVLTACGGAEGSEKFSGNVLDEPYQVASTEMTDTDGQPYSLTESTDKPLTLLFFGYTNCDDICHIVMGSLAAGMKQLDEKDREQVDVVFVTSDPGRDTAPVIRDYLDRFDPSFIGVRTDLDTVIDVAKSVAVGIDRKDPGGHNTQVIGIDSADEAPVYWNDTTTGPQFAADVHSLLAD